MENSVYIYGLKCPENGIVRYVGKSKKPKSRYSSHLSHTKAKRYDNIHLYRWIAKLLRNGLKPELIILDTCIDDNWKEKEKEWIAKFGLSNLLNMNEGGIEPPDNTGFKWTDEQKANHSSHKRKGEPQWVDKPHPLLGKFGEDNPNYGKKRSEEFKQNTRNRMLKNNPMKGKILSDSHKNKIREKTGNKVFLLDKNNEVIDVFKSTRDAATKLNIDYSAISKNCRGLISHVKGYNFIYTYGICSCGVKNENLKLSDRVWTCNSCGTENSRDHLASQNILKEGRKSLGELALAKSEA